MEKPRGVIIAGNWKLNHDQKQTNAFFRDCQAQWQEALSENTRKELDSGRLYVIAFPPFLSLPAALGIRGDLPIQIGAQNAHWEKTGAFTGEISGPMLKELGIRFVLTGHSERRTFFGDTNETVARRTESLLEQGFRVMACIGETQTEREQNETEKVLSAQLEALMATQATKYCDGRLAIAYEPVWAIGTGLTVTPAQAEEAHQFIRKFIWEKVGMEGAGKTPVLYGGSVKPDNIAALLACPNIDGGLVGGASLKPTSFLQLLEGGGQALNR